MPKTIEELQALVKEQEQKIKELDKPFDTSKLTDEDFGKIFSDERLWKNPRFKELNEKAKKADELVKAQTDAEQKKLEEDKKFQEALALEKEKTAKLEATIKQQGVDTIIRNEAIKAGALNPDTVLKLVDRSKIVINEDGTATGVTEVLKGLSESDKYLFGTPKLADGTNPENNNASPKFKLSQIQDASFYQANAKEIDAAIKNNQVENDLK